MDEVLQRLIIRQTSETKAREELLNKRQAIVEVAKQEAREDLTENEDSEFRTLTEQIKAKDDEIAKLAERIDELAEENKRSLEAAKAAARLKQVETNLRVSEARTYERGNGLSYWKDLMKVQLGMDGGDSIERLRRHGEEVRTDKEFRQLDRQDGNGGYFVPPLWLMQEFVELARAGRATANVVDNQALPPGTDSINVPKVKSGAVTGIQNGDNTLIANTDMEDDFVTAPVRTIAGEQDVAVQLLDQSPVNFDEVIFRDLLADYATKVDLQVIGGTGMNGQVLGIRGTSDIIGITWTEASPSVPKLYGQLADAVQRVHSQRFMPPSVIVMHPRRWGWFLAALDSTQRPLVLPASHNPQNAAGVLSAVAAEQVVGNVHGLPVVTDPNIPIDVGSSQDVILILRASDLKLYESSIRTRVVLSTKDTGDGSGAGARTLTSTLQVYGYIAFTAGRYPKSVAQISGSGLTTPDFSFDDGGS